MFVNPTDITEKPTEEINYGQQDMKNFLGNEFDIVSKTIKSKKKKKKKKQQESMKYLPKYG